MNVYNNWLSMVNMMVYILGKVCLTELKIKSNSTYLAERIALFNLKDSYCSYSIRLNHLLVTTRVLEGLA